MILSPDPQIFKYQQGDTVKFIHPGNKLNGFVGIIEDAKLFDDYIGGDTVDLGYSFKNLPKNPNHIYFVEEHLNPCRTILVEKIFKS